VSVGPRTLARKTHIAAIRAERDALRIEIEKIKKPALDQLDYDPTVPKRFSPKTPGEIFDAVFEAQTTRSIKAATEPYIGLWLEVDQRITDIEDDLGADGRGGVWTRATVNYAPKREGFKIEMPRIVQLLFYGEDARLVRALKEGDRLVAVGRMKSITGFMGGIVLLPSFLKTDD
jgi:hypothetical protein